MKRNMIDKLIEDNNGYIKTSDVVNKGISKTYFLDYVKKNDLERISKGLYISPDAWIDDMYVIQYRYPNAIFSHETASYLLGLSDRESIHLSITLMSGRNSVKLIKEGIIVYKVKEELLEVGKIIIDSPAGNSISVYNAERTICDLLRSRSKIEPQEIQTALKEYVKKADRNIPLLMQYSQLFKVNKIIKQYLEVLLS